MVIATDRQRIAPGGKRFQELTDADPNRISCWPAKLHLEVKAPLLLMGRHPALASQGTVGVHEEVAALHLDGNIVVEGVVLAVLKALEAIDHYLAHVTDPLELACLKKQAVSAEAADLVGDGAGGAPQGPGDLAVGHAPHHHIEDRLDQLRAFLPVGCTEGLRTEVSTTFTTRKPLYTLWAGAASEGPPAPEGPAIARGLEVSTVGVRTVGRAPSLRAPLHALANARHVPGTFSQPQLIV